MSNDNDQMIKNRRQFLLGAGASLLGTMFANKTWSAVTESLPFANGERELIAYPQKRKLMRK